MYASIDKKRKAICETEFVGFESSDKENERTSCLTNYDTSSHDNYAASLAGSSDDTDFYADTDGSTLALQSNLHDEAFESKRFELFVRYALQGDTFRTRGVEEVDKGEEKLKLQKINNFVYNNELGSISSTAVVPVSCLDLAECCREERRATERLLRSIQ